MLITMKKLLDVAKKEGGFAVLFFCLKTNRMPLRHGIA